MKDEEYLFHTDCREKKRTATGAFHKRSHCGKGGRVRLPSDNLSAKELRAMNGEVKAYRLNSPMTWAEFKELPDDLKIAYIKALREKYGVSTVKLAEMFGTQQTTVSRWLRTLGIGDGRNGERRSLDKEGWYRFVNGITPPPPTDETPATDEDQDTPPVEIKEQDGGGCMAAESPKTQCAPHVSLVPKNGTLTFEGPCGESLAVCGLLLNNANVRLCVSWEVVEDGRKTNVFSEDC